MNRVKQNSNNEKLTAVLEELRLMRGKLDLLLPREDIKDYSNPARIKNSYKKATKKYPPASAWK